METTMSKFKRHLKAGLLLVVAAAFALNCARSSKTKFAQNMENDAGKAAPTYEEWVALVGQEKTDQLYAGIGQDSLNLLAYGIGVSNLVQLIEQITTGSGAAATSKFVALIGNDLIVGTGPGGRTGLGAIITLYLIKQVDIEMTTTISANVNTAGGAVPSDQDTVGNLAAIINTLNPVSEVQAKLVDLMGPAGFDLSRSLAVATTETPANQQAYVQRLAKIVAHVQPGVSSCALKLCPLLTNLSAADVTNKLAPMIKGVSNANRLVEIMESTSDIQRMRALLSTTPVGGYSTIAGVTVANVTAKLVPVVNAVSDGTKMGYLINNVTNTDTLINIMNNVLSPTNLGSFLNLAEDGATWTGQVSPAETWGVGPGGPASRGLPFSTAGAGLTHTYTVTGGAGNIPVGAFTIGGGSGGTNYLPGVTVSVTGCTVQPTIHLNVLGGIIQTTGHYVVSAGSGCGADGPKTLTAVTPASSKTTVARLADIINGVTPAASYYKVMNLVDGVSSMTKMVQLVQDLKNANDVYDLLNNLGGTAGAATCTVVDGSDDVTVSGGGGTITAGTIKAFIVGQRIAYISVVTPGGSSGISAATTFAVSGCSGMTITAQFAGGVITSMQVNNDMNNLVQVVELLNPANVPRLVQVMDGQRTFDNLNEAFQADASLTTTYLGKLRVLMQTLSQAQEGPLKVGDLLNGVTNTDKIIDLIWGVTNTTNLATVINGIFKQSEIPGCSNGASSDADGNSATQASGADYQYNLGAANTTASDAGLCEASGNGAFWGERDRAVLTLVHLVENVTSSTKLVTMIDSITPAKIIDLVNHVSTYSQHNDADVHVYPRGPAGDALNTAALSAGGRRLVKIVENTTTISQLVFVTENVSSIIRMSKLVSFMAIGTAPDNGTGKLAVLINTVTGANAFLPGTVPGRGNPSGNATGMGKMVNVIEFISGATTSAAMVQLKNLLNDVSDINKMADLINQTVSSSNIVGLLNGVTDVRYGTSTTDLVDLLNNLPRGEISKLVSLIGAIGSAYETPTATFPGPDHELIAQLMATHATLGTVPAVVTATPANENITWAGHGLAVDRLVIFSNVGGTLPAPLVSGQAYFVVTVVDANNIRVGATRGGAVIDITTAGTGTTTANAGGVTSTSGVGVADMNALIGSLTMAGGSGYTGSITISGAATTAGGGSGAIAESIVSPAPSNTTLTRLTVTAGGSFTAMPTGLTIGGTCPGAEARVVGARIDGTANFQVVGVYLTNNGSGGCTAPTFAFAPAPAVPPTLTFATGGIIGFSVTNGGTGYTDSFSISGAPMTGSGGTGAQATALVAGPINTTPGTGLTNFNGGSGYVNGQVCPVIGAGGSGATCTVQVTAGAVTGCSAITGGISYIDNQVVTIGGGAQAKANVNVGTGAITSFTITNSGCGYTPGTISARLLSGANECATAGSYNATVSAGGVVTAINEVVAATGCPVNPTVIIGDSPYAGHGDNATALVGQINGGTVVALSLSTPADNLAQLLANTEKAPLYNAATYASTSPNISAREAMVRLIKEGVTYISAGWPAGYFNFSGVGSVYIGRNILGNLTGSNSTMTVINLLGSDTTGLQEFPVLMGCADRVQTGGAAATTFFTGCSTHTPNLW